MAGKTFNVGVVGYGMSAKTFHIPFIQTTSGLQLYAIVQRSPKADNSAPEDYPDIKHYTDFERMLLDPNVDVVVITTPPNSHFEQTKAAMQAGKHVLTEKPFVPTVEEAETLIAVSKETNRLLCVYQNRRWDSDFLLLKHLIEQGSLGRVLELNTYFDRYKAAAPTNWKGDLSISQGGSALFDLGTHLIDQVYILFGLPQAVHGNLLSQRRGCHDFENPDCVSAELTYPDGLLVHIKISAMSAETKQTRFWVRGSKGSFRKQGLDPQEDQLKAGEKPTAQGFGVEDKANMQMTSVDDAGKVTDVDVPELKPETYAAFYAKFAAALQSGKEEDMPVKATEARDVLRVIAAVVESVKSEKKVRLT